MIKDTLIIIGKTSFKVALRFFLLFIPAVIFNWLFISITGTNIFANTFLDIGPASRVPVFALLAIIPFLLVAAVYLIVFPFLFFNIARNSAMKNGLNYLLNKNKVVLIEYMLNKIFEQFKITVLDKTNISDIIDKSNSYMKKIKTIPRPIKWLINYFINKIPFRESIIEFVETSSITTENMESASEIVANNINEKFDLTVFNEKKKIYFSLLTINIIIMILTVVFLV